MSGNGSKVKSIVIKAFFALIVLGVIALLVINAIRENATVDHYTKRYNTQENLDAFIASPLGTVAEKLADSWDVHNETLRSGSGFTKAGVTTMQTPFLAVRRDLKGNWQVIGGSGKTFTTEGVKTLAVSFSYSVSASYRGEGNQSGPTSGGSSEGACIVLLDLETNTYQLNEIKPKALPQKTKSAPHYTLSDETIVKNIAHALVLPYKLDENGVITGGTLTENGYRFPSNVKAIGKLKIRQVTELSIPESVTSVAEGVIPQTVTLTVEPGSFGEQFAREKGYLYRKAGEDETDYRWLSGCECAIEGFPSNVTMFPCEADGEWVENFWYFTYNTTRSDGTRYKPNKIVTEPGSAAEAYVLEHSCRYRYYSDPADTVRIRRDGLDWLFTDKYIVIPGEAQFDSKLTEWVKKYYENEMIVPEATCPAAQALESMGVIPWVGTRERAERTAQSQRGTMTVVCDWTTEELKEIILLQSYTQSGFSEAEPRLNAGELLTDAHVCAGMKVGSSIYRAYQTPLIRVEEGTPAEIALGNTKDMVYLIEKTGVLCVCGRDSRDPESVLGMLETALDSVTSVRFSTHDWRDVEKKLDTLGIPYTFAG